MLKQAIGTISAAVLLALASYANAATKTDAMQVTATVSKNCTIDAPDLSLGAFDGTNDLTANSNISVRCTSTTPYTVTLSTGSGTYVDRTLKNGTDTLHYNLYTSNTYAAVWGDGTNSSVTQAGTGAGMGTAQTLTVYGRLLASANTGPVGVSGTYSDNITATISY